MRCITSFGDYLSLHDCAGFDSIQSQGRIVRMTAEVEVVQHLGRRIHRITFSDHVIVPFLQSATPSSCNLAQKLLCMLGAERHKGRIVSLKSMHTW